MPGTPAPFIVGVGRSGTTLLRLMLDAHPDLAIPAETHFLADVLRVEAGDLTRERFFRIATEAPSWANFGMAAEVFRDTLDHVQPFSASGATRAFYELYARLHAKNRWGDKTPPYRASMSGIARLLPEAHFIHLIRDGRDAALSYRGLWFGPGDDVAAQAGFWVEQINLARAQAAGLRHYLEIRYEKLVREPEATLRRICAYLDLPYRATMLDYHRFAADRHAELKSPIGPPTDTHRDVEAYRDIFHRTRQPPDPSRIGRWRAEMTEEERRTYEGIAGALLRELDYETGIDRANIG
jgi:Sulfotransferase family